MQLGIFAKTFVRADFEETFAATKRHGLDCIQFNLSCAGLPTVPESVDLELLRQIRSALEKHSLSMAAVSGTCNLIHPDLTRRTKDLKNLQKLICACRELGTSVVTLCTGTRDPADMWRAHPRNHEPDAWHDLVRSLEELLPTAEQHRVCLGIEPEPANVIDTALAARRLLDELKSPSIKIIFDAANLLQPRTLERQAELIAEGIDLLGSEIVLAHAKDLTSGRGGQVVAAGRGALDYALYVSLLQRAGFNGALVLHALKEDEVAGAVAFLKAKLAAPP